MGKTYDFDKAVDRRKTSCLKYDFGMERKGRDDLLPLWVADMDFQLPEEILADFTKGTYITAFQEGSGVPLLKQKNGDAYQPIFTDIIEFGKFNAKNQFKAIAVTANKIPSILVKEAKGVVVNPFGVNLQMPITKRTVPNPEAAAQAGTPEEVQATQVEVKADSERAGAQEEAEAENKTEN